MSERPLHYVRGNLVPLRTDPLGLLTDPELDQWIETHTDAELEEALDLDSDPPCAVCHRLPVAGPDFRRDDACIADLPGVLNACCGHGTDNDCGLDSCYVMFDDGLILYGNAARAAQEVLGGTPPPAAAGAHPTIPIWTEAQRNGDWPPYEWPLPR